ncbi:MAG: hypothetical protein SOW56_00115, partial [Bacteroidaceae bacterium]|nr:hypothetical protein [Bacteroidaceae bacterium]
PTNTTYPYLHMSADNVRIVPWLANSPSTNSPSFWYIEPTDDIYTSVGEISNQLDKLLSTDTAKYDLLGRPLNSPHKGQFYIQNGKAYLKE